MQSFQHSIPFIRLGSFSVASVGVSLTLFPLIVSFQPFLAQAILFGLAIGINVILGAVSIGSDIRKPRSHKTKNAEKAITAVLDASLAIMFLVLHIIDAQKANKEGGTKMYPNTIMLMYGAFCALIAS